MRKGLKANSEGIPGPGLRDARTDPRLNLAGVKPNLVALIEEYIDEPKSQTQ